MASSAKRKIASWAGRIFYTWVILELGLRAYVSISSGVAFFKPSNVIYNYYPYVLPVLDEKIPADSQFTLLILGGSAVNMNNGRVEAELYRSLEGYTKKQGLAFRIYNLSEPGHSSLDSRIKFDLVKHLPFDAVLVYHGINEVRANNCPRDVFREDYSHYAVYDEILTAVNHPEMDWTVLPYVFSKLRAGLSRKFSPGSYLPRDSVPPEWVKYGADIKTAEPFGLNMELIAGAARSRNMHVVLPEFAWYLPEGYSRAKMRKKEAGYNPDATREAFPVELWGDPENVVATLKAHNAALRNLQDVAQIPDLQAAIPDSSAFFDDICHLSDAGSRRFAEALESIFKPMIDRKAKGLREGKADPAP